MIPNSDQYAELAQVAIVVTTPDSELAARKHLSTIRKALKALETDIKAMTKPHKEAVKAITAAAATYKSLLEEKDRDYEQAILTYQRQVREAAAKAQAKAIEKYEKKVEQATTTAVADGTPMPLVLPPAIIATPPKTVVVDGVQQSTVARRSWRLARVHTFDSQITPDNLTAEDNAKYGLGIPLKYFALDKGAVTKVIRAGGDIPGIDTFPDEGLTLTDLQGGT